MTTAMTQVPLYGYFQMTKENVEEWKSQAPQKKQQ
jgi:hypothetical protein